MLPLKQLDGGIICEANGYQLTYLSLIHLLLESISVCSHFYFSAVDCLFLDDNAELSIIN